jgi:PRTRC genetic system protein F
MLFDSRPTGSDLDAAIASRYHASRHTAAGHRPAHGFLTVPTLGSAVPIKPTLRRGTPTELKDLVIAQFGSAECLATHVRVPKDAGHAFVQGFFGWVQSQLPELDRLHMHFRLMDANAVQESIQYQYDGSEFNPTSPLFLGIEFEEERIFTIGEKVRSLRRAHPRLLATMLHLLNVSSGYTVFVRLPDEFLEMMATWYWEGDSSASDEDVDDILAERFGQDKEEYHRYLPSEAGEALLPQDARYFCYDHELGRYRRQRTLGSVSLSRLRRKRDALIRALTSELLVLHGLLARARRRFRKAPPHAPKCLFGIVYFASPVYSAASLVMADDDLIGHLLDDHFNCESQGDGTTYQGFTPFATDRRAIRKQYSDWSLAFQIMGSMDRVLTLISDSYQ